MYLFAYVWSYAYFAAVHVSERFVAVCWKYAITASNSTMHVTLPSATKRALTACRSQSGDASGTTTSPRVSSFTISSPQNSLMFRISWLWEVYYLSFDHTRQPLAKNME